MESLSGKLGPFQVFCPFWGVYTGVVQRATFEKMSEEQKGRNSDVIEA